jgi:hypothetical protein
MKLLREPRIHPVSIAALRPTQITVGMREVRAKRKSWREHPDRKKPDFLGKHLIPVIWGPKEEYYVMRAGFSQLPPAALDYASVDDAVSAPEAPPAVARAICP